MAGLSLRLAVQPGVKVSSEACRRLGCLARIVCEPSAQACWRLCPTTWTTDSTGLSVALELPREPKRVPGGLSRWDPACSSSPWLEAGCLAPQGSLL